MSSLSRQQPATDLITKVNRAAQNSRLWSNVAELLWIEKINTWSIDLRRYLAEPQSDTQPCVEFSMADAAVLQEMHGDPELCVSRKDASYYTGLLAAGNQILVAKLGGSIVFYAVITFKYTRLWTRYFLHRADEFYISRCFTKTSYRGRGNLPAGDSAYMHHPRRSGLLYRLSGRGYPK